MIAPCLSDWLTYDGRIGKCSSKSLLRGVACQLINRTVICSKSVLPVRFSSKA